MTKKELLAVAKTYQISGRHEMTVVELQAAIDEFESERDDEADADEGDRSAEGGEFGDDSDDEENQQSAAKFQAEAEKLAVSKEALKNVTRRYPSLLKRDESGRILRAGKNLSGNSPFRHKFYYLNPALADESRWTPSYREAFDAAPAQVKGLLKYMAKHVASKNDPRIGSEIAGAAINHGYVVSKIDPDKLYAYYSRALAVLGVIHAKGYDPESEDGEESED